MIKLILVLLFWLGCAILGTTLGSLYVKRKQKKKEKYDPVGKW